MRDRPGDIRMQARIGTACHQHDVWGGLWLCTLSSSQILFSPQKLIFFWYDVICKYWP